MSSNVGGRGLGKKLFMAAFFARHSLSIIERCPARRPSRPGPRVVPHKQDKQQQQPYARAPVRAAHAGRRTRGFETLFVFDERNRRFKMSRHY
jgi:hypothetical protein